MTLNSLNRTPSFPRSPRHAATYFCYELGVMQPAFPLQWSAWGYVAYSLPVWPRACLCGLDRAYPSSVAAVE